MKKVVFNYSDTKVSLLVILRVLIGWHFLYEGIIKFQNPNWSAIGYLLDSKGFLSKIFYSLAGDPTVLDVVNFLNIWGLIVIGIGLILGCFTKIATISGIALLGLYYLSHPPFIGAKYLIPSEGNYWLINKTLIEAVALGVLLVFPTGRIIGIDRLIWGKPEEI